MKRIGDGRIDVDVDRVAVRGGAGSALFVAGRAFPAAVVLGVDAAPERGGSRGILVISAAPEEHVDAEKHPSESSSFHRGRIRQAQGPVSHLNTETPDPSGRDKGHENRLPAGCDGVRWCGPPFHSCPGLTSRA